MPSQTKKIRAFRFIRNNIIHKGKAPSVREVMRFLGYKSPRSAAVIVEELIKEGFLKKRKNGPIQLAQYLETGKSHARTVDVPLVGAVSCGTPILAEENIEGYFPVSTKLIKSGYKYFLLKAVGDSMNDVGINNNDIVLVQQQSVANNGEKVVALIDDEATVKEFYYEHGLVILRPRSKNKKHRPIILTEDFQIQGVVKAVISNF
jgi:repressor LexA